MNARKALRWFVLGGCLGILVAVLMMIGQPRSSSLVLVLWPTSIVGIVDPRTFSDKLLIGSVELTGNFIVYGVIAATTSIIHSLVWK